MKYYAVTDDPAELMHYGIKGMRWGVTRTPAQLGHPTRSAAYKRASGKLSAMMRNGIARAETKWKTYNSPANKRARAKAKSERQVERALSRMRKSGKAKLGKLSDEQIQRVTERLRLEQQARNLGGMEKRSMLGRIREAAGEGVLRGITQGTAGYIETKARGVAQRAVDKKNEELKRRRERSRRQMRRDAKADIDREYIKRVTESGESRFAGGLRRSSRRTYLNDVKEYEKRNDEIKAKLKAQRDLDNRLKEYENKLRIAQKYRKGLPSGK